MVFSGDLGLEEWTKYPLWKREFSRGFPCIPGVLARLVNRCKYWGRRVCRSGEDTLETL